MFWPTLWQPQYHPLYLMVYIAELTIIRSPEILFALLSVYFWNLFLGLQSFLYWILYKLLAEFGTILLGAYRSPSPKISMCLSLASYFLVHWYELSLIVVSNEGYIMHG